MASSDVPTGSGGSPPNCLSLSWIFGFSREVGVHNLCDENR